MPTYVLARYDEHGVRTEIPLELGTLGYPHVILRDANDVEVEVENDPPEAPPVGRFPYLDAQGVLRFIDFEPAGGTVTDGPLELLAAPITRSLDFSRRTNVAQIADTLLVAVDLTDDLTTPDLSGTTLEMIFRRGDNSALVRSAVESATVPGRVECQLQAGDVQSAGDWAVQVHVTFADLTECRSRPRSFAVLQNLPTS